MEAGVSGTLPLKGKAGLYDHGSVEKEEVSS
jgi:hypothetical protein